MDLEDYDDDPNDHKYWFKKSNYFQFLIEIINEGSKAHDEKYRYELISDIIESVLMLYGLELELLLKAIYLKKGNVLYENNKFKLPEGVKDGHDLLGWITILKPDYFLSGYNGVDKEVIQTIMECLTDYGKYPFKKNINTEKDLTIYDTDIDYTKNIL